MMNVGSYWYTSFPGRSSRRLIEIRASTRQRCTGTGGTAAECHVLTHVAPGYAEIQPCADLRRGTKIWCDPMQDRITTARRDR